MTWNYEIVSYMDWKLKICNLYTILVDVKIKYLKKKYFGQKVTIDLDKLLTLPETWCAIYKIDAYLTVLFKD